jgi:hypothetical protein
LVTLFHASNASLFLPVGKGDGLWIMVIVLEKLDGFQAGYLVRIVVDYNVVFA